MLTDMGNNFVVPQKVKQLPHISAITFLGIHHKRSENRYANKYSHMNIHSIISHNNQNMETTWTF